MRTRASLDLSGSTLVRYAPIIVYSFVYILTCFVAAFFFVLEYGPFLTLVEYFSGSVIPKQYTLKQAGVLWLLLLASPALLVLGYVSGIRLNINRLFPVVEKLVGSSDQEVSLSGPLTLFMISLCMATFDLLCSGAFTKVSVWTDYGSWIEARWQLFSELGYFNFVNLYLIFPFSAVWLRLNIKPRNWRSWAVSLIPLLAVVALTLMLFQKKALIVSLIIIGGSLLLYQVFSGSWNRKFTTIIITFTALVGIIYTLLTITPVLLETSKTASEVLVQYEMDNEHKKHRLTLLEDVKKIIGPHRVSHILAYTALSPMTRTSLPALYYPLVFPESHKFYGFDFGQDILGFGSMPDDNLVIWTHMYPDLPGGSAGAPFQFALYSQVGVTLASLISLMLGIVLASMWQLILNENFNRQWRSLMGTTILLFSIYIGIDSIRGSLLSSYGVIWAFLYISLFTYICRLRTKNRKIMCM